MSKEDQTHHEKYAKWLTTRLRAEIWRCSDTCFCSQPQVVRITPNLKAGFPWVHIESVWDGTFHSEADAEEQEIQRAELIAKAAEFNIPLDDNYRGERRETPE